MCLGSAATCRGRGAESGEEGTDDYEGWRFFTMMQQQEEDGAHKFMEKEQWSMASMPSGKDLLLVNRVLSLDHFI